MEIYSTFACGDMLLIYYREKDVFDFTIIPRSMEKDLAAHRDNVDDTVAARNICKALGISFKALSPESMIQYKRSGSACNAQHVAGSSMRNAQCTKELHLISQEEKGDRIVTRFAGADGLEFAHVAERRDNWLRLWTEVENRGENAVILEYLASFSLGMLSPFQSDDAPGKYFLHRMQSHWAAEGRSEVLSAEAAGLEMSWQAAGMRSLRFGQRSTMPVKDYFPFAAVEDRDAGVFWGAKLETAGAWELEISRSCDALNLSGGQPEREFNGWNRLLAPGEKLVSMPALVSCVRATDVQELCARLNSAQTETPRRKAEAELPVLFNEFCTTWGDPRPEKLVAHIQAVKPLGLRYFVLDDGWFCNDERGKHGDWILDETKYPDGFDAFLEEIRQAGMIPGIWFEFEVALRDSQVSREHPDWLLTLDGEVIEAGPRRFLDFRKPEVRSYLHGRVTEFLRRHRIGYVKIDYNGCIGCGCDGEFSAPENQRIYTAEVRSFFDGIRKELPELIVEICSSGGHRLTAEWLKFADMASFSDAHECLEIPIIAASVQQMIPLAKNQVWAVLRKEDDSRRLHYSLAAAMIGRMCLSGEPAALAPEAMKTVQCGVEFYRAAAALIASGRSRVVREIGEYRSSPTGWQCFTVENGKELLVIFHTFGGAPEKLECAVPAGSRIERAFADDAVNCALAGGKLTVTSPGDFAGMAFLLAK